MEIITYIIHQVPLCGGYWLEKEERKEKERFRRRRREQMREEERDRERERIEEEERTNCKALRSPSEPLNCCYNGKVSLPSTW